jgi:hypothetical protein
MNVAEVFSGISALAAAGAAVGAMKSALEAHRQRKMFVQPFLALEATGNRRGGSGEGDEWTTKVWEYRARNLGPGPAFVSKGAFEPLVHGTSVTHVVVDQRVVFPTAIGTGETTTFYLVLQSAGGEPLTNRWPFAVAYTDIFGDTHRTRIEVDALTGRVLSQARAPSAVASRWKPSWLVSR